MWWFLQPFPSTSGIFVSAAGIVPRIRSIGLSVQRTILKLLVVPSRLVCTRLDLAKAGLSLSTHFHSPHIHIYTYILYNLFRFWVPSILSEQIPLVLSLN